MYSRKANRQKTIELGVAVSLILIIWLSRLIAIDHFPPFIDEMLHVHGSEQAYLTSPLENADLGRQLTIWWMMLFQAHLGNPIWISRTATVLSTLVGVAAMMGIARLIAGFWGMLFAGLLYLFSTYHQFFGRLALADPISSAAILTAIYLAFRLSRRAYKWDALLVGVMTFLGIIAKINVMPYLAIPLAAGLSLKPHGRTWNQQFRWLTIALVTSVSLLLIFIIVLRLLGHDFFTNSVSYALANRRTFSAGTFIDFSRFLENTITTIQLTVAYLGIIPTLLSGGALLLLVFKRQFYLLLCLFGPLAVIWVSLIQESRFLYVPFSLLLVCSAVVLAEMLSSQNTIRKGVALTGIMLWGAGQWLPFAITEAQDPSSLPLPSADFAQYIYSDASGFGFIQIRDSLRFVPVKEVIGLVSNCQGFRYLSFHHFPVICPQINPNKEEIPTLMRLVESKRESNIYVLVEDSPYVPHRIPGRRVAQIQRPGGGPILTLYQLMP